MGFSMRVPDIVLRGVATWGNTKYDDLPWGDVEPEFLAVNVNLPPFRHRFAQQVRTFDALDRAAKPRYHISLMAQCFVQPQLSHRLLSVIGWIDES